MGIDLQDGVICAVGTVKERFAEYALRIMRAIRLAAEISFTINIRYNGDSREAHTLSHIAKERIRDEFVKLIMSDKPMRC